MNLKLNEWNESCKYAEKVCETLKDKGFNIKIKPYSMYNGSKGIHLQIFDCFGNFFSQYATGTCTNVLDMKKSIDRMANRIITET